MKKILLALPILFFSRAAFADLSASGAISFSGTQTLGIQPPVVGGGGVASSTPAVVQSTGIQSSDGVGTFVSSTFNAPTTIGNDIVMTVLANQGITPSTVTDSGGNNWCFVRASTGASRNYIYIATNTVNAVSWVQASYVGTALRSIGLIELSGTNHFVVDSTTGSGTGTGVITFSTMTFNGAPSMAVCSMGTDSGANAAFTSPPPFVTRVVGDDRSRHILFNTNATAIDTPCKSLIDLSLNWSSVGLGIQ